MAHGGTKRPNPTLLDVLLASAALIMTLTACGSDEGVRPDLTTTTSLIAPTPQETITTSQPTTTTSTTQTTGLLSQRDVPPGGVVDQFEFFQEGNGLCFDAVRPVPSVVPEGWPEADVTSMGFPMTLCFPGFEEGATIEIRRPDGGFETNTLTFFYDGIGNDAWRPIPGSPLGQYLVTVTQPSAVAEGQFTVVPADAPGIQLVYPNSDGFNQPLFASVILGEPFYIGLWGFEPDETVELYLYERNDAGPFEYRTRTQTQVGPDGTAIFQVDTFLSDPLGTYCVVFVQPAEFCYEFRVESP